MNFRSYTFIVSAICCLIFAGCSRKSMEFQGDTMSLQIGVEGITSAVETTVSRNGSPTPSSTSSGGSAESEFGFTTRITTASASMSDPTEWNEEAGNEGTEIGNPTGIQGRDWSAYGSNGRGATAMTAGYTYRLLLYNKRTGEFWKTVEAKAGAPAFLDAERGATYLWYAYSYNSQDPIEAPLDLVNPSVETSTEKTFMYAAGEVTIPLSQTAPAPILGILFQHRVAQLRVRIDARSLGLFAKINHLNATFDKNSYIKKGVFQVKENRISQVETVPTETIFNGSSENNIFEKSYYTVDPTVLSAFKITVNSLPVTFSDVASDMANRNLATYFGDSKKPVFSLTFRNPAIGQRMTTHIQLNYQPTPLRILHISNAEVFGYALQNGPSWDFLNSKVNFGDLPESVVKIGSWSTNPGEGAWIGGAAGTNSEQNRMIFSNTANFANQLADRLSASNTTNRPDIVILGFDVTNINPGFGNALNTYLQNKGVVVMMLQDATSNETMNFFNNLFGVSNIGPVSSGTAGAMYPIEGNDPNDVILNGPFGDVRNRHWGEDAGTTLGLTNVPTSQVTVYSYGNAINRSTVAPRITMFKHRTKSFFYVGDGGFVAYSDANSNTRFPFRYDPVTKRPLPKPYGTAYGNPSYTANSRQAYNSIIMANVMAWAVKKAELEGIRQWKYAAPPKQ